MSDSRDLSKKYSSQSILSKKRYSEISNILRETYGQDATLDATLKKICDIMRFDPEASRYTPELGKRMMENRKKLSDKLGTTTYVTGGGKKAYEKRKAIRIQTNT